MEVCVVSTESSGDEQRASNDNDEERLYEGLIGELTKLLRTGSLGMPTAKVILRAGTVLLHVGEWLVYREAASDNEAETAVETTQKQATRDAEALEEMILKEETGAPFPPVDPS